MAGLDFSRCPNLGCYFMAALCLAMVIHCVDDMIFAESGSRSASTYAFWHKLARLIGWNVPFSKSPPLR